MARERHQTYPQGGDSRLGRAADYLFGRNMLIGTASLMLLAISGFATWSGMNDFIIGSSQSPASQARDVPGGLSVSNEFLVIAITVTLTFLMWLALRETFGAKRWLRERLITFPLYLFLALWSVGFGYGFWWSLIAGEEATRSSLSGLQEDARLAGGAIAARLDAVRVQLDNVASWSETQMAREDASGGSCGIASGAGQGPLYNARRGVRDAIVSLRDGVTSGWVGPVQSDLDQLRRTATRLKGATFNDRQQRFEALATDIRTRAHNIAARSNEFGKTTAAEMSALADSVSIAPREAGFSCYDPTLAKRLRLAAAQASEPAVLKLRDAAFNEGPAGVANAVKGLWNTIGEGISNGVSFVFSGFKEWPVSDGAGGGLTGRDLIALLATLGIDLGLFVLTALNPPARAPNRISESANRQIRDAMETAVNRAPGADFDWVRGHFIHHKDSGYFIIPNLYSAKSDDSGEAKKALAMNQLAGVMIDLDLIRWPTKKEMAALKKEEQTMSDTDLTIIRRDIAEKLNLPDEEKKKFADKVPLRNHGLFSKAERMLQMAGWSAGALRDLELFKLVDTEGLTPLLATLNDARMITTIDAETIDGTPAISGPT